jgi:hypothetical protein
VRNHGVAAIAYKIDHPSVFGAGEKMRFEEHGRGVPLKERAGMNIGNHCLRQQRGRERGRHAVNDHGDEVLKPGVAGFWITDYENILRNELSHRVIQADEFPDGVPPPPPLPKKQCHSFLYKSRKPQRPGVAVFVASAVPALCSVTTLLPPHAGTNDAVKGWELQTLNSDCRNLRPSELSSFHHCTLAGGLRPGQSVIFWWRQQSFDSP